MLAVFQNAFYARYRFLTTLRGHTDPVVCLAISPNGKYLASGGKEGIKIWNLKTAKEIPVAQQPFYERSQVSSVCWVTRRNEVTDTVCYGNALGCLVFMQYHGNEDKFESILTARLARGGEITCITVDTSPTSTRIATRTRDKCIQVWTFDANERELRPVFLKIDKGEREIVPKALAFDNNPDHNLYIFGLYDGGLYKNAGKDGKSISRSQLGSQIGNAAVDIDRKLCVVDNLENGFDLSKMDSGVFVKTFVTKHVVKTHPKCVVSADRSRLVIGGSDHGRVYVFERKTGQLLEALTHARKGGVETLAVRDLENGSVLIATASATSTSRPGYIHLWQWKPTEKPEIAGAVERWSLLDIVNLLFKLVVLFAAAAYFVQQGRLFVRSISGDINEVKHVIHDVGGMPNPHNLGGMVIGAKKVMTNIGQMGGVKRVMEAPDVEENTVYGGVEADDIGSKKVITNVGQTGGMKRIMEGPDVKDNTVYSGAEADDAADTDTVSYDIVKLEGVQ